MHDHSPVQSNARDGCLFSSALGGLDADPDSPAQLAQLRGIPSSREHGILQKAESREPKKRHQPSQVQPETTHSASHSSRSPPKPPSRPPQHAPFLVAVPMPASRLGPRFDDIRHRGVVTGMGNGGALLTAPPKKKKKIAPFQPASPNSVLQP